jgi:riboflavin synthase
MFTGIIQFIGEVAAVEARGGDIELRIAVPPGALEGVAIGDSIAVNGCCLTATRLDTAAFTADVSRETLAMTTLSEWRPGRRVNLEKSLTVGQSLGGHYVMGHIDGVARVVSLASDARSTRVLFGVPPALARYVARKGSVAIDGVSLTVNEVEGDQFGVNLIPHTLEMTILKDYRENTAVNLEVDLMARYLERLGMRDPRADTA